jgi:GntR family transcriptional repressor for pyruvate dehydrogenase complex
MAALMTTSRTSMREALIVLETLGIIEVRGKQGLFVKDPGMGRLTQSLDLYATWPADVIPKVFQVRIMMESPAAGLAALNRTDADLAKMNECWPVHPNLPPRKAPRGPRERTERHLPPLVIAAHNEVSSDARGPPRSSSGRWNRSTGTV